ncbi:hypothetical protein SAMN05216474_0890 [Lishizhenia tianjinensis]|uniref:Uncharacterized protein n=2 Tax=Lishizhenia tianjinensis TaxID=477690 RepID=A0A1I6YGP8_9FLAO|nr:hypothetical protein SAMN05216474_0890 [Lishizhenia tianjinensis]
MISFVALNLRKSQIKKEVKLFLMTSVDKKDLYFFRFSEDESKNELHWEKDHEFEYQGKMYDIVEQKKENDTTSYWCWLDREETELNAKLKQLTHFNFLGDEKKKNCDGALIYFMENQYFPPQYAFHFHELTSWKKDNFSTYFPLLERNISPFSPPPDLL